MMNRNFSMYNQPKQSTSAKPRNDTVNNPNLSAANFTVETCLEICRYCIEYVNNERFIHMDSNLSGGIGLILRPSNPSTNAMNANPNNSTTTSLIQDMRTLLESMIRVHDTASYGKLFREYDSQPQVILAAAFYALRYMPATSLWSETYDEILSSSDSITEDYNQTKTRIIFKFLNRYLTLKMKMTNITSAVDLAVVVSGYLCKPKRSAYLSVRHQEDLRRIRPIVSFLIERYPDIFTKDLKPIVKVTQNSTDRMVREQILDKVDQLTSAKLDLFAAKGSNNRKLNLPSLLVSDFLPRESSSCNLTPSQANAYTAVIDEIVSPNQEFRSLSSFNMNHWEYKILESIIQSASFGYLKRISDQLKKNPMTSPFLAMNASMTSPEQSPVEYFSDNDEFTMKSYSKELSVTAGVYSYKSPSPLSPVGGESPIGGFSSLGFEGHSLSRGSSTSSTVNVNNNLLENSPRFQDPVKKWSKKREQGLRRRMISECKAIRGQIMQFEQEFKNKSGREPKSSERGHMQTVYSAYRDMKRTIRDISAIDIQRFTRSYIVRLKLKRSQRFNSTNTSSSNSSNDFNSSFAMRTSASTPVLSTTASAISRTSSTHELISKYRELQSQKRDIKRQLKRFDEDFTIRCGRAPKKSDKEVMRPMYQSYHDIKAKVDELKKLIESMNGGIFLDDAKDEDAAFGCRSIGESADENDEQDKAMDKSTSDTWGSDILEKTLFHRSHSDGSIDTTKSEESSFTCQSLPATPAVDTDRHLMALLEEKKNLHAYLKAYERDFNKTHGRAVMKEEDIHPVANEYQRYKALKLLIKEAKVNI